MNVRRSVTAFAAIIALGLASLLIAGGQDSRSRAFSLGVPDVGAVATLPRGHTACESPILAPAAFAGVRLWADSISILGGLSIVVSDASTGRRLARGQTVVTPVTGPVSAALDATVPAHDRVTVCLHSVFVGTVVLLGSGQVDPSIRLTVAGRTIPLLGVSLVTLTPRPRSLLALVPTIFARASLFRPGWVASWTFWVLTGGVVLALLLVGGAIAAAGIGTEDPEEGR